MQNENEQTNASTAAAEVDVETAVRNGAPDEAAPEAAREDDLQAQLAAQQDKYLRLAAEYDNFRKRTAKETQQAKLRGQADVIRALLNSLDDLARFAHVDPSTTDLSAVIQGVEMVERNINKALADLGVEVIDPVELPFDPNLHEAVTTQAAETPDEDHMVAQVYQRGYLLNGQLVRPARVVVKQYL